GDLIDLRLLPGGRDDDECPLLSIGRCDCSSNSAAPTGDHCDLVFQFHGVPSLLWALEPTAETSIIQSSKPPSFPETARHHRSRDIETPWRFFSGDRLRRFACTIALLDARASMSQAWVSAACGCPPWVLRTGSTCPPRHDCFTTRSKWASTTWTPRGSITRRSSGRRGRANRSSGAHYRADGAIGCSSRRSCRSRSSRLGRTWTASSLCS